MPGSSIQLRSLPAPQPSAGLEAYRAERERRLEADPRCRANYERYQASSRREADVDYLPIKLDIENVSRCNFRCTMCVVSDWPRGRRAADMSLADFERLLAEQYGLVEIKLQGIGEPTMQGDDYFAMIRHARARHIWVRTTTNASLLHLKDNHRRLVDSGVSEIQISIDGATKPTYESIRRGGNFERVIANCRLVNECCTERGLRITKMWTVVQRANRHQLFALLDLAHDAGFRDAGFAFSLSGWGLDEWRARNDAVTVEDSLDLDLAEALLEHAARLGVRLGFWNTTEKFSAASPGTMCPWPFERAVVSSDGRVAPCCTIGNPDAFELGSAVGGFTSVWLSPRYARFRRAHLEGRIPEACRSCYANAEC